MPGYLILVGMQGAGKSVIGRELAKLTFRGFIDTDNIIEKKINLWINDIFEKYGEEFFRDQETKLLKSLKPENKILSTGGGIVTREENWKLMQKLGTTIFLDSDPVLIKKRLSHSKRKRPILLSENWQERFDQIYAQRRNMYEKADVHVKLVDESIQHCTEQILKALEDYAQKK